MSEKETRHGKRAEGKTATSISLEERLLKQAREAAASEDRSLSNWLERLLRKHLDENEKVVQTPRPTVATRLPAAAGVEGAEVNCEILELGDEAGTTIVEAWGESMLPTFKDGQEIRMTHRSRSRSPYMKKGLIYLVFIPGRGHFVKRYDTRKPLAEEEDAEYLNDFGMVGVLCSDNPDFPEIVIEHPETQWEAWYDEK